jgi:SET domain-containing protein
MLIIKAMVKSSPIHGLGCFAAQAVESGQLVWEFHPAIDRRWTTAEVAELPPLVIEHLRTYAWVNPADRNVLFSGDHSQFFNHSDRPNTRMSPDGYRCVASRAIAAGEELTSDYGELLELPEAATPMRS